MTALHILITMDCERARSETDESASGPSGYAESEAWVRAFDAIARDAGFPVTYFLHPEVAAAQPGLYRELRDGGACLGLHLHPWRFGDGRFAAELGGLTAAEGRAVITAARRDWAAAIGELPAYFRPGAMSANDTLFPLLADLGFRGGSCSMPGRVYPDVHAVWAGAEPDPHRAHAAFRQRAGGLDFAEIPISVDLSSIHLKNGRWYHWDLRPDFLDADYEAIAANIVGQIVDRAPAVPALCLATHNDNDFTDPADRVRINFERVLAAICAACAEHDVEPLGATVAEVTDLVLRRVAPVTDEVRRASGKVIFQPGRLQQFVLS